MKASNQIFYQSKLINISIYLIPVFIIFLDLGKQLIQKTIYIGNESFFLVGLLKDLLAIFFGGILLIAYIFCVKDKKIFFNNCVTVFITFWLIYLLVRTLFSENMLISAWGLRQYIEFLSFYYFCLIIPYEKKEKIKFFDITIITSLIISLLGLIRYYVNSDFLFIRPDILKLDQYNPIFESLKFKRFTSLSLNPNECGIILVCGILALFYKVSSQKNKFINIFLISILTFCLFLTYSRSSWIGLLSGLGVMFFAEKRTRKIIIMVAVIIILIFLNSETLRLRIIEGGLWNPRFINWSYAFNEVTSKENYFLFGFGIGTIGGKISFNQSFTTLDNYFLTIFYEAGLIGLVLFVLIFLCTLKKANYIYKFSLNAKSAYALIIAFFVSNLFSPTISTPWGNAIFWISFGLYMRG